MKNTISLNDIWKLKKIDDDILIPAKVPGYVISSLQANGMIQDIYTDLIVSECEELEKNEYDYIYEFEYKKPEDKHIEIVFEGIDTIASVFLNGNILGETNNMFIHYRYDVSDIITDGINEIIVHFPSQSAISKQLYDEATHKYASVYDSSRVFIRKAQYQFGWDWCPRVVCGGIWRNVKIEEHDGVRLYSPSLSKFDIQGESAKITATVYSDIKLGSVFKVECIVKFDGVQICRGDKTIFATTGVNPIDIDMLILNPKLWYPTGMGEQNLYNFEIQILNSDEIIIDSIQFNSGLRKVEILNQVDEHGESFIFMINGKKLYAKGANYIPTEMLPSEREPEEIRRLVKLAKQANMNMLRIWGGGYYECHEFYDECDIQGILIWQDFMFACGEYPDEFENFRDLVRIEAEHVVKDLSCHPSIILWCGSNENVWALHDWWKSEDKEFLGRVLYQQILPAAVKSYSKLTNYWESSPFGGESPNCMDKGDSHFWDVWADWKDIVEYTHVMPRFCSEFGMQSMPALKTGNQHISADKRLIPSLEVMSRNCQTYGPERTMRYIFGLYGIPKGYEEYTILSQLSQNEAMRLAVEGWRSKKYLNAGVLFWQFNDCWPGASQSCVDYYLRKKAVFYGAQKFYNEVIAVCKISKDGLIINVVNDMQKDVSGTIMIEAFETNGKQIGNHELSFDCLMDSIVPVGQLTNRQIGIDTMDNEYMPKNSSGNITLKKQPKAMRDIVIFVTLKYDGSQIETTYTYERPRYLSLNNSDIQINCTENQIMLSSDYPVLGVWIETENETDLSDNYFDMKPGIEYIIKSDRHPGKIRVKHIAQMIQILK